MARQHAPTANVEEVIEAVVEDILYRSADGRFTVARVLRAHDSAEEEELTAVGDLGETAVGETLRLQGRFSVHPTYGRRFKVQGFTPTLPTAEKGIVRYLGSGLVEGVGPTLAERLVDRFGARTLDVIATQSARLREVPGIGRKRAEAIAAALRARRSDAEILSFLQGLGLGPATARRIQKRYGADTARIVRDDPYLAAERVAGIGFRTADRMARALGIEVDDPRRAAGAILHLLAKGADDGHVYLEDDDLRAGLTSLEVDPSLLEHVLPPLESAGFVILDSNHVYAPPLFIAETQSAERLARLSRKRTSPRHLSTAIRAIEGEPLSDEQRSAVAASLESGLTVLTGGPGTGKTTTVRALVRAHSSIDRRVLLCAPTGRAAKRLYEATGTEAKTIHRLLEWNPATGGFQRDADNPLDAETILVDEASMLDLRLAADLLSAIPDSSHLVLVGDVDQLPPVGAGHPLRDLIASGAGSVVRLERIFRQAERSAIVRGAHQILHGHLPDTTPAGEKGEGDLFSVYETDPEAILEKVVQLLRRVRPAYGFDPKWDVQVLTPMRRGPLGTEGLNALLQETTNPPPRDQGSSHPLQMRSGDKVMQTRNDYERDVFNGDIGEVVRVEGGITFVRFDGREVQYPADELGALSLAYASTIHKVQGSEFPAVIVLLHGSHHVLLSRSLLYTAVTRAKRLVVLLGDPRAFRRAARNEAPQRTKSALAARIGEACGREDQPAS